MKIEVKATNLTKSKILQMEYIGIPSKKETDVFGWVNVGKKRWVIVKTGGRFYRAEYITKIEKEAKGTQFRDPNGGWEFPVLTHITVSTFNRGSAIPYSPHRDEAKNIELAEHLRWFQRETDMTGQIYY